MLALLLLAPSAGAHFHGDLQAPRHDLSFRWASGTVLVEEAFEVRNDGTAPFGGHVYAWLPEGAGVSRFGPVGGPSAPVSKGPTLWTYNLTAHGLAIAPNGTLALELAWSAPLPEGASVERHLVYPTGVLDLTAAPPLAVAASPRAGAAEFGDSVRVVYRAPPLLEGWQALVVLTAALLLGAWLWDRRRRGPAKP